VGCLVEQKVNYATYTLTREARLWWHAQKDLLAKDLGNKETITWTLFQSSCQGHYVSVVARNALGNAVSEHVGAFNVVKLYKEVSGLFKKPETSMRQMWTAASWRV
jgi:hypothetical protein